MDTVNKSNQGYRMHDRCPLYSLENRKQALSHLVHALKFSNKSPLPLTMIITGAWPQEDEKKYIKAIENLKDNHGLGSFDIFSIDTLAPQMNLIKKGYSTGNVGQRPIEMGRNGIDLFLKILENKEIKEINYTGFTSCIIENYSSCLE